MTGRKQLTALAAGLAIVAVGTGSVSARSANPFVQLAGNWSGSGQARLDDGRSERLRCRAYYAPRDNGANLGLAIRCASTSYKIELRGQLANRAGRVTGSWEERSFNASGSLVGHATSGTITLAISGGVSGSMQVSFGGSSQRVAIRTQGIPLKGVFMSLSRG